MPKMFGFFLIAFFVMCECEGMTPPELDSRAASVFPKLGFELCSLIVNTEAKKDCTGCFANADSDWLLATECVSNWLPTQFASCVTTNRLRGNGNHGNSGGNGNHGNSGGNGHKGNSGGNGNQGNSGGNGHKGNSGGNGNQGNSGGNGNHGNSGGNGKPGNTGGNTNGGSNNAGKSKLQSCLKKAKNTQMQEINRAKVLYKKGGQYMKTIMDSTIIKDGGATIFSCMSQELLIGAKELHSALKDCESCFSRFKPDPVNEQWHLGHGHHQKPHKHDRKSEAKQTDNSRRLGERTLVYDYGYVGNDMPFHGVGPLASDVLKGECIYKNLAEAGKVNDLLSAILENDYPVPAWIFRELLNNISILNLP
ncbi:uncharacterized protein [Palaemon carinicauda]|uniref:uncharacterized protein isoform X2 n=1 Tax=Palaemon carinicauda TaxID=392227 RepID=UPI0035B60EAA